MNPHHISLCRRLGQSFASRVTRSLLHTWKHLSLLNNSTEASRNKRSLLVRNRTFIPDLTASESCFPYSRFKCTVHTSSAFKEEDTLRKNSSTIMHFASGDLTRRLFQLVRPTGSLDDHFQPLIDTFLKSEATHNHHGTLLFEQSREQNSRPVVTSFTTSHQHDRLLASLT